MLKMINMALIRCPVGFRFFRRYKCCFLNEKSQIDTENDKNPKLFQFSKDFQTFWIGALKRVNKKRMCCSVGFFEEFIAVSLVKMSQINTENNKKPMNFSIFKVLMHFWLRFRQTSWVGML